MTIVVLASARDEVARGLVERWKGARLMTPRDLSRPGWVVRVPSRGDDRIVASDVLVAANTLEGVLVRLAGVQADDLPHIIEADREYVAAEMSALLIAWLSSLPCLVINRARATSILGPNFGQERWLLTAARLGIPVAHAHHAAPDASLTLRASVPVAVVGERWFGDAAARLGRWALQLARHVGADALTAQFSGSHEDAALVAAHPVVDVESPPIADALYARFVGAPSEVHP